MRRPRACVLLVMLTASLVTWCNAGFCEDNIGEEAQREKWRVAEEKERAPRTNYAAFESELVERAKGDPDQMWSILTSPDTPYVDRMAVANQAPFSPKFLHELVALHTLLEKEENMHQWGFKEHPLNTAGGWRRFEDLKTLPQETRNRKILGLIWQIPSAETDYPITEEEDSRAPWPRQIKEAVDGLWIRLHNGLHDDEWAKQWMSEALKLPWSTDEDAAVFVQTTNMYCARNSPLVMQRWMDIAANPSYPKAAMEVAFAVTEASGYGQPLQCVMIAELILNCPHKNAIGQTCFQIKGLRGVDRQSAEPATVILAASRLALDPDSVNTPHSRLCIAADVLDAIDNPPFKVGHNIDPESPEVKVYLDEFSKWFKKNEDRLIAASESEKPLLDKARAFLSSGQVWQVDPFKDM